MKLRSLILLTTILIFQSCNTDKKVTTFINEVDYKDSEQKLTSALILKNVGKRGMDIIEYRLLENTNYSPKPGLKVTLPSGDIHEWTEVEADENGWFFDFSVRRGYYYFSVKSDSKHPVLLESMGNNMVFVNGIPHTGNRYQYKDSFESWEPKFNFYLMPVMLEKGVNHFLFQCSRGRLKAIIHPVKKNITFNPKDVILPDIIGSQDQNYFGSIVLINNTSNLLEDLSLSTYVNNSVKIITKIDNILPMSIKKIPFEFSSDWEINDVAELTLELYKDSENAKQFIESVTLHPEIKTPDQTHRKTYISSIDNSIQYYAVNPGNIDDNKPAALFLSLHGANVEAINQANSYYPKNWGHIVSPTNRRPFGFDWEDWGRIDALDVLNLSMKTMNIDPQRVYLTGHSMGGHGTYYLGVTYPDKFAAIGPSAGWISFNSYASRSNWEEPDEIEQLVKRAANPGNTLELLHNMKENGIYIIHGKEDNNVRADQSYKMIENLEKFHSNYYFHEEEGVGHWWDKSPDRGADCVDWFPMFDYFAHQSIPENKMIRNIDFTTANPEISSKCYWINIIAQEKHLEISNINITFNPGNNSYKGLTKNISRFSISREGINIKDTIQLEIDDYLLQDIVFDGNDLVFEKSSEKWRPVPYPSPKDKNPQRYGTFKGAFNHNVLLVYGTKGNKEQNNWAITKARYDSEVFWYQGNGSMDIMPDYKFDPEKEKDRGVILYGNKNTNSAWKKLLADSPVIVENNKVIIGKKTILGNNLSVFYTYPRKDSNIASVGVVAGTGINGMRLTNKRPYLYAGFHYPDLIVLSPEVLLGKKEGYKAAGYFGTDWSIENGEIKIR